MARPLSDTTARLRAILPSKTVNRQIFRALLSLASAALLVRMMGLLNQVVVSSRFGAGPSMDAYFIAAAVPTLLAQLLGGAIEASIVPTYARVRAQGTKEQAHRLFSTLLNLLIVCTVVTTLVMLLLRSQVVFLSAPGSRRDIVALSINLVPFIFPAFVLLVVISYLECILNTEGQFGWPAYAGMLVPLTTAAFVFTAGRAIGVAMLCVGMVAGLCLQLCVFIIRARRAGLVYMPVLDIRNPEIAPIARAALPVLVAALVGQGTNLIDLVFSSYLPPGSISALNYALKLTSVFTGVVFTSVGRAVLPYLSRQASMKDMRGFKETLRLYIWIVGIATAVLSVAVIVLAHPLVHLLFQRGAFSASDTNRTAATFIGFAVGLTPIAFVFVILRAFSALGKTGIFLRVTLFSLVVNAVFDYIFSRLWQSEGIALSTSVSYVCTMFILFFALRRSIGELHIFTPPAEIADALRKVGGRLGIVRGGAHASGALAYSRGAMAAAGSEPPFPSISLPYRLRRQLTRLGIIAATFAAGVAGVFVNSLYALRISLASVMLFALMRYNFLLLLAWVLLNGPNALPVFRGSNILIGLSAPTLLLLPSMPFKRTVGRLPALGFLALYLLAAAATVGISPFGLGASLTAWVLRLDCLAVSILAINIVSTRRRLTICIDVLLAEAIAIALYGLYGYITKQNGIVDSSTSLFRIVSIFSAAPGFALYLSIMIPLALYRAFTSRGIVRAIALVAVLLFLTAAALTFTRSAYISIPLSLLIMTFFAPSRQMKNALMSGMAAVAVVAVVLAVVGNVNIFSRFTNQDLTTLNGRTYLWQALLGNFDVTRLLGNGIRASDALLINLHLGVNGQGVIATSASNLFVGTLYDHGVIGLALLMLVFLALAIHLLSGMRRASGERRLLLLAALVVLVNVLIESIDSNDFWDQSISVYIWIVVTLPFTFCWPKLGKEAEPDPDFSNMPTETRLQALRPLEKEPVALV